MTTELKITKAELHVEPIGWIRISWDTPVSQEHADAALLEAISPSHHQADDATVERVARAVSEAGGAGDWDHAKQVAKAAIAAMPAPEGNKA